MLRGDTTFSNPGQNHLRLEQTYLPAIGLQPRSLSEYYKGPRAWGLRGKIKARGGSRRAPASPAARRLAFDLAVPRTRLLIILGRAPKFIFAFLT